MLGLISQKDLLQLLLHLMELEQGKFGFFPSIFGFRLRGFELVVKAFDLFLLGLISQKDLLQLLLHLMELEQGKFGFFPSIFGFRLRGFELLL